MSRLAVVLFNLGGPDGPDAVQPFLFNLFNDSAIISLPAPLRWLIASLISRRRAPIARAIYDRIGGRSPLLELTRQQATALQELLGKDAEVFVAMRYWHPMTEETVRAVQAFQPDEIVLLPLYPQYSATTSGSSISAWKKAAAKAGLTQPTSVVCCYPSEPGLIASIVSLTRAAYDAASRTGRPRVLFSAHGLPKKVISGGDPYQFQVEQTAAAIVRSLTISDLDAVVCYQSRVGPLEWIGPSTDDEIRRAGADKVPVVVVPIAFVSEHSETLVELDIEYRELAHREGVPEFLRVPTVGTAPDFIAGLASLIRRAQSRQGTVSQQGARLCPSDLSGCPCKGNEDGVVG